MSLQCVPLCCCLLIGFYAVIWAYISYETAQDTKECFDAFIQKFRSSQTTRWQALGMLSFVIDSMDQSWEIKDHTLDFLLHVIDEETLQSCDKEESLCYLISIFNTMQVIDYSLFKLI